MGEIHVHEFMTLDGVIDTPTWTVDHESDPRMGEAIGAVTERSRGILLGRATYQMFEPAWSVRSADDDPGATSENQLAAPDENSAYIPHTKRPEATVAAASGSAPRRKRGNTTNTTSCET